MPCQVIKLANKAKSTVMDHVVRKGYELFTETRVAPLRRYKELGVLGNSAVKLSLIHASNVDAILRHFKVDEDVVTGFSDARRTSVPPACRHRAGAAARDHLIVAREQQGAAPQGGGAAAQEEEEDAQDEEGLTDQEATEDDDVGDRDASPPAYDEYEDVERQGEMHAHVYMVVGRHQQTTAHAQHVYAHTYRQIHILANACRIWRSAHGRCGWRRTKWSGERRPR
jgi:hypothetical protein